MKVEKIDVGRSSLASLMHDMKKGRIRIPRFQRIFVWERKRIQELLDSMLKEYPIGTIFLWKAPSEYNHLLRTVDYLNQPPLERFQSYSLLLDGQQRLTSLYAVVNGLTVEEEDYRKNNKSQNNVETEGDNNTMEIEAGNNEQECDRDKPSLITIKEARETET